MLLLILLLIVVLFVVIILVLLLFGFIHIEVDVRVIGKKPEVTVKILLWKIPLSTIRSSNMKMDGFPFKLFFPEEIDTPMTNNEKDMALDKEKHKNIFKKWEPLLAKLKDEENITQELLNIIQVHRIRWTTTLGLDEAPLTAIGVGLVWTIKYNLIGLLNKWLKKVERPLVDVRPAYQEWSFQTHIKCMITFRIGKAIHAAYRIAKLKKRGRLDNARASNTRANENGA